MWTLFARSSSHAWRRKVQGLWVPRSTSDRSPQVRHCRFGACSITPKVMCAMTDFQKNAMRAECRLQRLVRWLTQPRTALLWHLESPGMRIKVTRTWMGRMFKPADFATLGECIADGAKWERGRDSETKLLILADRCCEALTGGECGWERMDFDEFTTRCADAIRRGTKTPNAHVEVRHD